MKKSFKKIALMAILAFCFQPTSADCILRNGDTPNGVCRSYIDDSGFTGYKCLEKYWFQWGDCNVNSSISTLGN